MLRVTSPGEVFQTLRIFEPPNLTFAPGNEPIFNLETRTSTLTHLRNVPA
jgi:hypothetical protein